MITLLIAAMAALAMAGIALYLNAALRGHGATWRRAFTRAWRNN